MNPPRAAASAVVATLLLTVAFATNPSASAVSGSGRAPGAPAPTTDACGPQIVKPDGSPWACSFADDFSGKSLDRTKWLPHTAFVTGTPTAFACYLDDPSTVKVAGGHLNLTVRKVSTPVSCRTGAGIASTNYVAGMVSTYRLFSQQYGRFEARIRNTAATDPGLHEAFWLWPDDRVASSTVWPESGEIDVSETFSSHPTLSIPFLHYSADSGGIQPGLNTAVDCTAYRGQWNTYTLVWSPTRIEILVNGKTCLVNTSADPAFQKPYIAAFTQALGKNANGYDGRAPLPATMSIDYLRVWK